MLQDVVLEVPIRTSAKSMRKLEDAIEPHRFIYVGGLVFISAEIDPAKSIIYDPDGWLLRRDFDGHARFEPSNDAPDITAVYKLPAVIKELATPCNIFLQSAEKDEGFTGRTRIVCGYDGEILTCDDRIANTSFGRHRYDLVFRRKALSVLSLRTASNPSGVSVEIRRYQVGIKNGMIFQKSLKVPTPPCLLGQSYKKRPIKDEDRIWLPAFEAAMTRMSGQCVDKPCFGHYYSVA